MRALEDSEFDAADAGEPLAGADPRPLRDGTLRDLLDREYRRSYRFEGMRDFFHGVQGVFRRMVTRDADEVDGFASVEGEEDEEA